MNVLVTGGAGFIGSHLCERLVAEAHAVSIVDDLNDFYDPRLKRENLEEIRSRGPVEFLEADICDSAAVERFSRERGIEAIIHLAARAGVRPSLENPLLYERTNVQGTISVLEAARQTSVSGFIVGS